MHGHKQRPVLTLKGGNLLVELLRQNGDLVIRLGLHCCHGRTEAGNLVPERVILFLGLLFALGGTLDALQQVWTVFFEVVVEEGHVRRGLVVGIGQTDGVGLELAEAVEVELPGKAGEIRVLEVLGQDGRGDCCVGGSG